MDLHRKTREMLNKDVMLVSLGMKKLQTMNEKIQNQLKQEKISKQTKQMRVEELEQWVIELGANPKYIASIQALMKTKDIEIQSLKKNLIYLELIMFKHQNCKQCSRRKINC
jgi:HPt (histidine-containing phosphotransfer) domain-containing protein